MLAVNIKHALAQTLEGLQRDRVAIYECPGAPVSVYNPAKHALVSLIKRLLFEPAFGLRQITQAELSTELGALRAASNQPVAATVPEYQSECIDEDRLAGASLSR